ncbi:MAG: 2,3-bisphosphoglycerate-independent phosphoglycerate mutase [Candidatus Paceibacterota bacterium]|jgi:2,3-bisphosphoglycerate-independent phosphoglycerate mutase
MKKPLVYIILDGWGLAPAGPGNAISLAQTPNMNALWANYPHTEIGAGGEAIGLPDGHQGSSEIGHLIIGAGRNVYLPQGQVEQAISSGEIFSNPAYQSAIDFAKKNNSTLHLAGLMSDKGVHNYDELTFALIEMAAKNGLTKVIVHFISDGRDTRPDEAKTYLTRLENTFAKFGIGQVGTVMGRYFIMDRDHRWDRVEKGYSALVDGVGDFTAPSPLEAIDQAYTRGETDEFIKPTVIVDEAGAPIGQIKNGDALVWVNFRTDRSIEITQAFIEPDFQDFARGPKLDIKFVGTFKYYDTMPADSAFTKDVPKNTMGEIVSQAGLKQFRVAETEKWIYVTTIFSGMREEPFPGEDRKLISSDKIATYDLAPKMHALDIAQAAVEAINSDKYELIMMNFANPDIVGHTGNIAAAIEAVEECDRAVGLVVEATKAKNGLAIISADHGNVESMLTADGQMETQHSANKVPLIIVCDDPAYKNIGLKDGGALQDVTPTILEILGVAQPTEMTGQSLIAG